MRNAAACILVLAGCAKQASNNAANPPPGDRERGAVQESPADPTSAPQGAAPPAPGGGGNAGPVRGPVEEKEAKEIARSQGLLGPTDKDSFRPLDPAGSSAKQKEGPPRSGGPAPTVVGPVASGVSLGTPVLTSKADGNLVAAALGKHQAELDKCYATARSTRPTLAGNLTVAFTIKADGTIAMVTVASTTVKDAALETCVIGVVQATKLEKSLGGSAVKATLPITFAPPPKAK